MSVCRELTSELLEAAVTLTHPDRHAPERAGKAGRVTAGLLALRPYVRPAEIPVAGEIEVPLWVSRRTLSATGIVCARSAYLLSFTVVSLIDGASLTLHDGKSATNPSTGIMTPHIETRFPGVHHRVGIFAVIRGEMTVTFDYLGAGR